VKQLTVIMCCWLILLACIPLAYADGFRNPFQSAAANAQGGAFAAQADDPSAIHYNPAGMTQLSGIQYSLGLEFVNISTRFRNASGTVVHNDIGGPVGWPPPGQMFVTVNLKELVPRILDRLTLGLGVESLYGFGARYPDNGPFASAVTSASFPLLDIKPTIAYRITDRLSVGLGADIFTFASFIDEGHFEQQLRWPGGLSIAPGTKVEINGRGHTAGLNASVLFSPILNENGKPRLNVGFVWRSQAVLPLHGQLIADGQAIADASTNFRFPETYAWAIAAWPIRDGRHEWKVEVDIDYVRWQSLRNADVQFSNGTALIVPLHWTNAVNIGWGTEYKRLGLANHPAWDLAWRAGYLRSVTPIPNVNFSPALPDSSVNVLSVGFGMLCKRHGVFLGLVDCDNSGKSRFGKKGIGLDVSYQLLLFDPRTVAGNPNPTVNGEYHSTTHAGTLTAKLMF
jgi:long-chain fatty acid transport protein